MWWCNKSETYYAQCDKFSSEVDAIYFNTFHVSRAWWVKWWWRSDDNSINDDNRSVNAHRIMICPRVCLHQANAYNANVKLKTIAGSFRVSFVIDSTGPWYFRKMPWHFSDKKVYFKLQSSVGICKHRLLSWCHFRCQHCNVQENDAMSFLAR